MAILGGGDPTTTFSTNDTLTRTKAYMTFILAFVGITSIVVSFALPIHPQNGIPHPGPTFSAIRWVHYVPDYPRLHRLKTYSIIIMIVTSIYLLCTSLICRNRMYRILVWDVLDNVGTYSCTCIPISLDIRIQAIHCECNTSRRGRSIHPKGELD